MGQRSGTETLFGIVAAFVEKPSWTQSALAKRLETSPETVRKRLVELQAGGFKLERFEEPPQVWWSVPKDWFPGVLPFKREEATDLLRLLGRARPSELRARLYQTVVSRLSNFGQVPGAEADPELVSTTDRADEDERWLSVVEDAKRTKTVLKMKYFTASRGDLAWRQASVHSFTPGPRPHFIATCHKANELRRFRVSNVQEAVLDRSADYRPTTPAALTAFDDESFGGFRHVGPVVHCAFVVRDPECKWVARNLPDRRLAQETAGAGKGMRFSIDTSAVFLLARFVVGLGDAAHAETPELREAVASLARGALANAIETKPA